MSCCPAAPIKEKQVGPPDASADLPTGVKQVGPGEADTGVVGEPGLDPSQGIPLGEELSFTERVDQLYKSLETDTDPWSWLPHQNSYRWSGEFVTSF